MKGSKQEETRLAKALQELEEKDIKIWKDSSVEDSTEQALAYCEDEPIELDQLDHIDQGPILPSLEDYGGFHLYGIGILFKDTHSLT